MGDFVDEVVRLRGLNVTVRHVLGLFCDQCKGEVRVCDRCGRRVVEMRDIFCDGVLHICGECRGALQELAA